MESDTGGVSSGDTLSPNPMSAPKGGNLLILGGGYKTEIIASLVYGGLESFIRNNIYG